uniref:Uncharacterized protein n=1 Tax=Cyprinus carpio TaxID=7962 RepID=A0A8C1YZ45_CYPCA
MRTQHLRACQLHNLPNNVSQATAVALNLVNNHLVGCPKQRIKWIVLSHQYSDLMQVTLDVATLLGEHKVDAIVCVAGGWAGGNCGSKDLYKNSDMMWKQSVWTSTISSHLASLHLKPGGLLTLSGAKASLEGTPGTVGASIPILLRCVAYWKTHVINVFSAQVYLRTLQNLMLIA